MVPTHSSACPVAPQNTLDRTLEPRHQSHPPTRIANRGLSLDVGVGWRALSKADAHKTFASAVTDAIAPGYSAHVQRVSRHHFRSGSRRGNFDSGDECLEVDTRSRELSQTPPIDQSRGFQRTLIDRDRTIGETGQTRDLSRVHRVSRARNAHIAAWTRRRPSRARWTSPRCAPRSASPSAGTTP